MNVLSSEDANGSSVQSLQAYKKNRKAQAALFSSYESAVQKSSERQVAKVLGVPRTTLQHWRNRKAGITLSMEVVTFFEGSEGIEFLHQLVSALLFIVVQVGGCGIRIVSALLERCQLDRFVACSTGYLHKLNAKMEEDIVAYGKSERELLAKDMPPKKISMCGDETFHPAACLVAIEPVSNFILTEKYSEKRDAASWSAAMGEGLKDLPVEIIQSASDEGKGLVKYVEKELGAHHSPDLFHVQQELTRATSAPLRAKIRQAEKTYADSIARVQSLQQEHEGYARSNKAPCGWTEMSRQANAAKTHAEAEFQSLNAVKKYHHDIKEAKKALGDAYHPYDLQTASSQSCEEINEALEKQFSIIQSAADNAELSDNSLKRLDKAHRVFNGMINTIAFFWRMVKQMVDVLGLSPEMESLMREILIPASYLRISAKKARTAMEKHRIVKLSVELLDRLELIDGWCKLDPFTRDKLKASALNCAQLFQRSSSCVEGRNGYLSLRHHGLHGLSTRKLAVLTVLHNYYIQRADRTTAAERFFEQKPRELFGYLFGRIPCPARPAKKRIKVVHNH
jgi:hypothetical protein